MIDTLLTFLHDNQFLSGGFLLMLSGGLMALLRSIPGKLWNWFKKQFILSVDVTNDDPIFEWLALWLANHPYSRRARMLTATTRRTEWGGFVSPGERDEMPIDSRVVFTPAPGNHLFIYNRRLVWLSRERKDVDSKGGGDGFLSRLNKETFNIRILGRKQSVIRQLIEEAGCHAQRTAERQVEVYISAERYWQSLSTGKPRPIGTVILPKGHKEDLLKHIQEFLDRQDWYISMGIPYRCGFLFHGVPGSGKTSLIASLAGEFKMNLYVLNVGGSGLTDDGLSILLSIVPPKSMLLLEDIDCVFQGRVKDNAAKEGVTFSGLLNALDGVGAKEGCLVFMTTNRKDTLDPALIRPGRADYHLQFDYADAYQASEMFRRFYPDATAQECQTFADHCTKHRQMSMAELQQHLLVHRDDKKAALGLMVVETAA
jgi:chaperone BCS1